MRLLLFYNTKTIDAVIDYSIAPNIKNDRPTSPVSYPPKPYPLQ